jgi:hypothetical protein
MLSPVQPGLPCVVPPLELIYHQKGEPKLKLKDDVVGHSSLLPHGKANVETYALSAFGQGPLSMMGAYTITPNTYTFIWCT